MEARRTPQTDASKEPKRAPREPQESSKRAPRDPKRATRELQESPKRAPRELKRAPREPRRASREPKRDPREPKKTQAVRRQEDTRWEAVARRDRSMLQDMRSCGRRYREGTGAVPSWYQTEPQNALKHGILLGNGTETVLRQEETL